MDLIKCTFDELPSAMQMHVLYCEKVSVSEYRLAIWSNKDTLYYNDLPEKEVERFAICRIALIISLAANIIQAVMWFIR